MPAPFSWLQGVPVNILPYNFVLPVTREEWFMVEASVTSGGLKAPPFGENHGGLFRSFEKSGNGKYRLHAHVGAGDLTLR
jgi:hypothetical protein